MSNRGTQQSNRNNGQAADAAVDFGTFQYSTDEMTGHSPAGPGDNDLAANTISGKEARAERSEATGQTASTPEEDVARLLEEEGVSNGSFYSSVRGHALGITMKVLRLLDSSLKAIASDPEEDRSVTKRIADEVIDLLPATGTVKGLADAREMARKGKLNGDDKMVQKAKVRLLLECYQANIDLLTFGATRHLSRHTKYASKVVKALVSAKALSTLPTFEEYFTPVAENLLKSSRVNAIVEKILEEVPEASAAKAAAS